MRRLDVVLVTVIAVLAALLLVIRPRASAPPSPHCRGGPPLAGVYHSPRLEVRKRCAVASGIVTRVKFEEFDGDVHVDLRLDPGYEHLLSDGNDRVGGNLLVEVIPFDRARVAVPEEGARVEVVGPWVQDDQHGWNEIHPAWWVSGGRVQPASAAELRAVQMLLQTNASDSQ